ncbi:diguanylate cyclase (GGDEF) domain-containing protein [Colwellia chukchiensis]|uniref:diguanylate cyclase n=2 Tax=Colwellia chukchiensis TaxID=641665 RepID=A0A1H7R0K0_9GAMM|nr:GGDEF domain-containing protein [Colwellia chukchiensis]SEL53454.1 diguanylate cyclase (GGDEF) domain-containing protein [Colwellia chukchiensis]
MRTVNVVNHPNTKFNAFTLFQHNDKKSQRNLAILERLQTTLDIKQLIDIFATEVAKYLNFSGLYFKHAEISVTAKGSRAGKVERQFELRLNECFFGIITYSVNSPISLDNYKVLNELHHLLLNPLNNAVRYHQAMQLAMQDALTQLGNRRHFDEEIKRTMAQAIRRQSRVGLILCDLNKFKAINDSFGHTVGDNVLIHFADALRQSIRDADCIFRFGGDEFAIIVCDASPQSLSAIEQRIQHAIAQDALLAQYKVGCGLGLALMNNADSENSLFERADSALYRQKMTMAHKLSIVALR